MTRRRCEITARRSAPKRSRRQVVGFDDLLAIASGTCDGPGRRARGRCSRASTPPPGHPRSSGHFACWTVSDAPPWRERLASDPDLAALAGSVVDERKRLRGQSLQDLVSPNPPEGPRASRWPSLPRSSPSPTRYRSTQAASALSPASFSSRRARSALPLVGVGLLYRETSHQWLDDSGLQQESWEVLDFERLPLELAHDAMAPPRPGQGSPAGTRRRCPGMDCARRTEPALPPRHRPQAESPK